MNISKAIPIIHHADEPQERAMEFLGNDGRPVYAESDLLRLSLDAKVVRSGVNCWGRFNAVVEVDGVAYLVRIEPDGI